MKLGPPSGESWVRHPVPLHLPGSQQRGSGLDPTAQRQGCQAPHPSCPGAPLLQQLRQFPSPAEGCCAGSAAESAAPVAAGAVQRTEKWGKSKVLAQKQQSSGGAGAGGLAPGCQFTCRCFSSSVWLRPDMPGSWVPGSSGAAKELPIPAPGSSRFSTGEVMPARCEAPWDR